jgi:hypothetical protein
MSILTVAIPFRGNFEYLRKSILSVSDELTSKGLWEKVEVLVSCNVLDNAINAKLQQLIHLEFAMCKVITHQNELTFDAHMFSILVNAKGKFVKFLADDDWLEKNYIQNPR